MNRWVLRWVLLLLLPSALHAQDVGRRFRSFRAGGDTVVAIAFLQPATGRFAWLGADIRLHAASMMKVPVLVELARRIDAGELRWSDSLPVENRFTSIADGSEFSVDAADDSDSLVYTWLGQSRRVDDLARHMMVRSSNLATNILIQRLDPVQVNATARALGADSVEVLRGVEDGAAYRRGMNNTLTARGMAKLLEAILLGRAASAAGTRQVLALLAAQELNEGIPSGVPAGTLVAHKTGWITGITHDGGIVYPASAPPYILVVLTRGLTSKAAADSLIGRIAAEAHRVATGR